MVNVERMPVARCTLADHLQTLSYTRPKNRLVQTKPVGLATNPRRNGAKSVEVGRGHAAAPVVQITKAAFGRLYRNRGTGGQTKSGEHDPAIF
jgi:hypothetical protein